MTTSRTYRATAAACAMALVVGVTASAADAKMLRFTTQIPAKNFATQNAAQFAQCIADGSDIEIYDSAQLYRDKEGPQAVSSGAIDMGMTTTARFAGTIPAIEILNVPRAACGRSL